MDEEEDGGDISDSTSVSTSSKADPKGKSAVKRSRVDNEVRTPIKKRKATATQAHDFIKDTLESIASTAPHVKPTSSTTLSTAYPVFLRPSGVDAPSASRPKPSTRPDVDSPSLPKKKKKKKATESGAPSSSA